jgi:hypothetical protein
MYFNIGELADDRAEVRVVVGRADEDRTQRAGSPPHPDEVHAQQGLPKHVRIQGGRLGLDDYHVPAIKGHTGALFRGCDPVRLPEDDNGINGPPRPHTRHGLHDPELLIKSPVAKIIPVLLRQRRFMFAHARCLPQKDQICAPPPIRRANPSAARIEDGYGRCCDSIPTSGQEAAPSTQTKHHRRADHPDLHAGAVMPSASGRRAERRIRRGPSSTRSHIL